MDVLSDVLLAVRLTGAVFFDVDASSPFATETPSIAAIGERVLAGPQHVISFHVVTEGTCWAEVVDRSDHSVSLSAGDMVVFPRGDANIIASAPGMRGRSSSTHTAGSEAMLAKLAELMFVEAIRNHIALLPAAARGWLAGVRDPQVGAALRLMHGRPAEPWTVERLAHGVGMSRSAFVQRFSAYVQIPPMQYLARWRLQLAARMLESGTVSVAQASAAVGYQSEAAFNRAFKREVGLAPGTWRRGQGRARSGA